MSSTSSYRHHHLKHHHLEVVEFSLFSVLASPTLKFQEKKATWMELKAAMPSDSELVLKCSLSKKDLLVVDFLEFQSWSLPL